MRLHNRIFFKPAYHIERECLAVGKEHDCLIPEIFGAVVVVQANDSVARLSYVNLRSLIFVVFIDEIVNAGAVDARNLLCLSKQRAWNDIGRHG